MADWRRLNGSTWTDKKIIRLSRDARLLFIALITLADDEGYVDGDPTAIRAAIFPADGDLDDAKVGRLRDELVTAALLVRYDTVTETYLHLPHFGEYQKIRRDLFKPSKIKAYIKKHESCKPAVTNPLRTRNDSVTDPLPTVQYSTVQTTLKGSARKKRPRASTVTEQAFLDGFEREYGIKPEIDKENAIKLAEKVGKYGTDTVVKRINAWWTSPAGDWVKDARTIGAFLHSFDAIVVNNRDDAPRGHSKPDLSRFDRATRPVG